jgi:hypothetical protein
MISYSFDVFLHTSFSYENVGYLEKIETKFHTIFTLTTPNLISLHFIFT